MKLNTNGAYVWTNIYPTVADGFNAGNAVAVDSANNYYVTGYSPDTNGFNDIVTIKYNSNGGQVWLERYSSPVPGNAAGNAIAVDANFNVYVAGYDTGPGGGTEMVLIKYSPITLEVLSNGTVQLQAQGAAGELFNVQATSDLQNWQTSANPPPTPTASSNSTTPTPPNTPPASTPPSHSEAETRKETEKNETTPAKNRELDRMNGQKRHFSRTDPFTMQGIEFSVCQTENICGNTMVSGGYGAKFDNTNNGSVLLLNNDFSGAGYVAFGHGGFPSVLTNAQIYGNILPQGVTFQVQLDYLNSFGWFLDENTYLNNSGMSGPAFTDPMTTAAHTSN